jgi:simple sugar transport system ATP-binding protein
MSHLISMRNVRKDYSGVQALKGIDFNLEQGGLHCLIGENGSGKSTLIKILSGVVQPETGAEISIGGRTFPDLTPHEAIRQGIRVIYQDLSLFPNLTVKENVAFPVYAEGGSPLVSWREVEARAREALAIVGLDLDLERKVGSLSIAEQQLVEISKCLIGNLRLLILDEPTASLTRKEVNALFAAIRRLQARGVTTLFVSHKLNEIFEIAEQVTILRDGDLIGTFPPAELDAEKVIFLMTGKQFQSEPPQPVPSGAEVLLELDGLAKAGEFQDVSLHLRRGEILGITGLLGSGRTELALAVFGLNPPDAGEIRVDGRVVRIASNLDAARLGIALVPEDRMSQGAVLNQPIIENMTVTVLDRLLNRFGLLDLKRRADLVRRWVEDVRIKAGSLEGPLRTLSGGNQQKVVLAKWLATEPRILILDEPTVGIDVFAKNNVHDLVKDLARKGIGIILISDEIQEVLGNCHRVLVMERGRIVHELVPGPDSERELLERFNLS